MKEKAENVALLTVAFIIGGSVLIFIKHYTHKHLLGAPAGSTHPAVAEKAPAAESVA